MLEWINHAHAPRCSTRIHPTVPHHRTARTRASPTPCRGRLDCTRRLPEMRDAWRAHVLLPSFCARTPILEPYSRVLTHMHRSETALASAVAGLMDGFVYEESRSLTSQGGDECIPVHRLNPRRERSRSYQGFNLVLSSRECDNDSDIELSG